MQRKSISSVWLLDTFSSFPFTLTSYQAGSSDSFQYIHRFLLQPGYVLTFHKWQVIRHIDSEDNSHQWRMSLHVVLKPVKYFVCKSIKRLDKIDTLAGYKRLKRLTHLKIPIISMSSTHWNLSQWCHFRCSVICRS